LTPDLRAEIELARLGLLQRALGATGLGMSAVGEEASSPQAAAWAKKTRGAVEDPFGQQWLVPDTTYWSLHENSLSTAMAERIAYEAVNAPAIGECEASPSCVFNRSTFSEGLYLKAHPTGPHAAEVMKKLEEMLRAGCDTFAAQFLRDEPGSVPEALDALARLEVQVSAVPPKASASVLKALRDARAWVKKASMGAKAGQP
jgi:hypothetical protein